MRGHLSLCPRQFPHVVSRFYQSAPVNRDFKEAHSAAGDGKNRYAGSNRYIKSNGYTGSYTWIMSNWHIDDDIYLF